MKIDIFITKIFTFFLFSLFLSFFINKGDSQEVINKIVAIVNDEIITLLELQQAGKPIFEKIIKETPPSEVEKKLKEATSAILDQMIDMKLIEQKVKKFGIEVSDAEVSREIERQKELNHLTQEDLEKILAQEGTTFEEYKENYKKKILTWRYVEQVVVSKIKFTDEKLKSFYLQNQHLFKEKDSGDIRIGDILLRYPKNAKEEEIKNIKKKALSILNRINSGESFESLAKQYSEGPTAKEGGDSGFFKISQLQDSLREEIEKLEIGQVSNIIETPNGIHIIKLIEKREDRIIPFEKAKFQIMTTLREEEFEKAMGNLSRELRENAFIEKKL